jgi:hypothetical protein
MIQVLVDADNVPAALLARLLRALPLDEVALVVAGSRRAVGVLDWPGGAAVHRVRGPQRADDVLLAAYRPGSEPLVLVSGDKGFARVVRRPAGPVLVVADRPATALRAAAPGRPPARDGGAAVRAWCDAHVDAPWLEP